MKTYKGYQILRWNGPYGKYPDSGEPKYYIQRWHKTGIQYSFEHCTPTWSMRQAKEIINREIQEKGE